MLFRTRLRFRRYSGSFTPAVAGVVAVVAGLLLALALRGTHSPRLTASARPAFAGAMAEPPAASRKVFPLSVIHGGAYSREELARARRTDAVVAAHYADFGTGARFQKLSRPALMYVSYRRGNQVFWSRTRHPIPQGETVINDGHAMARARCGNRLSETPQGPVAPKEPEESILNTPEIPEEPVSYNLTELPGPASRTFAFNLPTSFDSGTTNAAPTAATRAGADLPANALATPIPPGPSGLGAVGGSGPAAATSTKKPGATASLSNSVSPSAPVSLLPVSTTGGTTLPSSPNFPPSGSSSPLPPAESPANTVPEPYSFGFILLLLFPAAVRVIRRPRS